MSIPLALAGLTFLATLSLTPLVRRIVQFLGIVDRPDGRRKLHGREVPLGGGLALFAALTLVGAGTLLVPGAGRDTLIQQPQFLMGLYLAATVICAVGLVDDRVSLRGRHKLAGQIVAIALLIASGFQIRQLELCGMSVELEFYRFR